MERARSKATRHGFPVKCAYLEDIISCLLTIDIKFTDDVIGTPFMASKLSPATPRAKYQRVTVLETDTTPTAAKPGSSMFADHGPKSTIERRSPRPFSTEKRVTASRGAELQQAQEELSKTKELLALAEKSKSYLVQDLARSKRHVEDLMAKLHQAYEASKSERLRAHEMEQASFTAAEDWQVELEAMKQQYEEAVEELQTNKQAMETLKHELIVCVEAKEEAVRLAGEAMNAAELTAKRVEELSSQLVATKGSPVTLDPASSRMEELMNELAITQQGLAEACAAREKFSQDGAAMLASKEAELKKLADAVSSATAEIEALKQALALARQSEVQLTDFDSTLENLKSELAAAKEAEQKVSVVVANNLAAAERAKLEMEKARKAESIALASLANMSADLEETQQNLFKATIEGAAFVTSLEFLKTELQRSQLHIIALEESETSANAKVAALNTQLTEHLEIYQTDLMDHRERESAANAEIESLKADLERLKSELVMMTEREGIARANATALATELERNQREVIEQQEKELSAIASVTKDLESNRKELSELKEKESGMVAKIRGLMSDLERKNLEVGELKDRVSRMEAKALVLSETLTTLTDTSHRSQRELKEREANANAKVASLNIELAQLQKQLEEAIKSEKLAREDVDNLRASLQIANLEKHKAKQEAQTASVEAECNRQDALGALAKAQTARDEVQTALKALQAAKNEAHVGAEEVNLARADVQAAREDAQLARGEAEAARERLEAAMTEARLASIQVGKAREEAQFARKDVELLNAEVLAEKEEANVARIQSQAAKAELENLKTELHKVRLDEQDARAAWNKAENRLQDVLREMEALKFNGSSLQEQREMADHGAAAYSQQQELDRLKMKLQDTEERLAASMVEVNMSKSNMEELLRDLEVTRVEKEANKRAVLEAHQHLADTEKAKSIMEAEIQRLLDESKQCQSAKDAIDIPVHSETNGNTLPEESREKKPQPDPLSQVLKMSPSLHHNCGEEQKEEVTLKEIVNPKDDITLVPTKKKKKLLQRLGTYLEKKKNQQAS